MTIETGIDVSGYQPNVVWPAVAKAGFTFAYVKASQGVSGSAYPTTSSQWDGAKASGLTVGMYHYAEPAKDPKANALTFANWVMAYGAALPGCLPPCVDYEIAGTNDPVAWLKTFIAELRAITGKPRVMVYTGASFFLSNLNTQWWDSDVYFWIARYGSDNVKFATNVVLHQFTNKQHINGSLGTFDASTALVPVSTIVIPRLFPRLYYGLHSNAVLALQKFMTRVFPKYNKYTPTGYYGDDTKAGIAEFQRQTGIGGDGSTIDAATSRELAKYGYSP